MGFFFRRKATKLAMPSANTVGWNLMVSMIDPDYCFKLGSSFRKTAIPESVLCCETSFLMAAYALVILDSVIGGSETKEMAINGAKSAFSKTFDDQSADPLPDEMASVYGMVTLNVIARRRLAEYQEAGNHPMLMNPIFVRAIRGDPRMTYEISDTISSSVGHFKEIVKSLGKWDGPHAERTHNSAPAVTPLVHAGQTSAGEDFFDEDVAMHRVEAYHQLLDREILAQQLFCESQGIIRLGRKPLRSKHWYACMCVYASALLANRRMSASMHAMNWNTFRHGLEVRMASEEGCASDDIGRRQSLNNEAFRDMDEIERLAQVCEKKTGQFFIEPMAKFFAEKYDASDDANALKALSALLVINADKAKAGVLAAIKSII